jgi:hypothetical protein
MGCLRRTFRIGIWRDINVSAVSIALFIPACAIYKVVPSELDAPYQSVNFLTRWTSALYREAEEFAMIHAGWWKL